MVPGPVVSEEKEEQIMTTKDTERKALEEIRKIVDSLGLLRAALRSQRKTSRMISLAP